MAASMLMQISPIVIPKARGMKAVKQLVSPRAFPLLSWQIWGPALYLSMIFFSDPSDAFDD